MPHQFAAALDHPLRLRYRNVPETLGLYGFAAGMTVLDLGCGTGTFTLEMARMVGEDGMVYAVDLQQPMVDAVRERADEADLTNRISAHCSGAYALPLAEDSCDLVIVIATLSQIPDRLAALLELRRVLRPGGRLAVSEELADPAYVPSNVERRWIEDSGFEFIEQKWNPLCYHQVYANPGTPDIDVLD